LIAIDNDHAFVDPILKEKGHRKLQVKTIIYCLEQMQEPMHPEVRDEFLKLDPEWVIETWLRELTTLQIHYDELFDEADRKRLYKQDKDNPIITRIPFKRGIIASMYQKFIRIQEILRKQPHITGSALLRQVMPLIGIPHEEAFKKIDNPDGRFRYLFGQQYSAIVAERYGTLVNGKQILQSMAIPEQAMIASKNEYSPSGALNELKLAKHEETQLGKVKEQLLGGNPASFLLLYLDNSRETILQAIDLNQLDAGLQKIIFQALEKASLHRLVLKDCTSISENSLKRILENSPSLIELDISGCHQLSMKILDVIATNCLVLEKLDLSNLPQLVSVNTKQGNLLGFNNLRRLWINHCGNLKEVEIIAPRLQSLTTNHAKQLALLRVQGHELSDCSFEQCSKIPQKDFERLMAHSPKLLQTLRLRGNYNISSKVLSWHCVAYGVQQWSVINVNYLLNSNSKCLDLNGLSVIDSELKSIASLAMDCKHIDLRGCHRISWQGLSDLFVHCKQLDTVKLLDYNKPNPTPVQSLSAGEAISGMVVGPENNVFISSRDKTIKQYDIRTEKIVQSLQGHNKWVTTVILLPNGNPASGSFDKTIKIWDQFTGMCLHTLKGHAGAIHALCCWKDKLLSASQDKTIKIWRVDEAECMATLGALSEVHALEMVADTQCISGSQDGKIKLWNLETKACIKTLAIHRNSINVLKKVAKTWIASGSSDHTIKITDFETDICLLTLTGHDGPVYALEVLSEGVLLASASLDKTIKIWDVTTGECLVTLKGHAKAVRALRLLDKGCLLSAGDDGEIKVWHFPTKILQLQKLQDVVTHIEIIEQSTSVRLKLYPHQESSNALRLCIDIFEYAMGKSGIIFQYMPNMDEINCVLQANKKKPRLLELIAALNRYFRDYKHFTSAFSEIPSWQPAKQNLKGYGQASELLLSRGGASVVFKPAQKIEKLEGKQRPHSYNANVMTEEQKEPVQYRRARASARTSLEPYRLNYSPSFSQGQVPDDNHDADGKQEEDSVKASQKLT